MKLVSIFLILLLLNFQQSVSQNDFVIKIKQTKKGTTFSVKNKSKLAKKINLIIKSSFFKEGSVTIEKIIKPNQTKKFLKLRHEKNNSFKTEIIIDPITKADIFMSKTPESIFFDADSLNIGIVIFTKKDCSRCRLTENYFEENNIVFKNILITNTENGRALMWKLLAEKSAQIQHVTMPVILNNGKISYSHENLVQFLKDLKN